MMKNIALLASKAIVLTRNQQRLVDALSNADVPVVVCVGPAGTGKTMLACRSAQKSSKKVVFTRPTVVSGDEMGYLPGTLRDKMDPFMYHIVRDNSRHTPRAYEICSLQHMRGRTFDNAFVFADEMQNSTIQQMKMFLTRVGHDSKVVVCGDETQSDLREPNGLAHLADMLRTKEYRYLQLVELDASDIARSEAAREISGMYDACSGSAGSGQQKPAAPRASP